MKMLQQTALHWYTLIYIHTYIYIHPHRHLSWHCLPLNHFASPANRWHHRSVAVHQLTVAFAAIVMLNLWRTRQVRVHDLLYLLVNATGTQLNCKVGKLGYPGRTSLRHYVHDIYPPLLLYNDIVHTHIRTYFYICVCTFMPACTCRWQLVFRIAGYLCYCRIVVAILFACHKTDRLCA